MHTVKGIGVEAWVNLDDSCPINPEVFADRLQIGFGTGANSLGLVLTENTAHTLRAVLTDALDQFAQVQVSS